MTQPNPFAQFQASQTPAQAPQQTFAPAPANPFATGPAMAPQQPPQGGFGGPPVQTAPVATAPAGPALAAGGFGYGMPDLSGVTESSGRLPQIPAGPNGTAGISLLSFVKNEVLTQQGHTVRLTFTIKSTNAPHYQPESEVVLVQKIPQDQSKRGRALGAILACIRGVMGFADEAAFKAAVPNWSQFLAAALAGQPLPFVGRQAWCQATPNPAAPVIDKITKLPTGEFYNNLQWAPVAAA